MKGRKTGGRKKGTANKRTQVFGEVAAAVAQIIPDAFHGNAHALLMSIYKDPRYPVQVRMDAAKAAISFETPRLSAIEHKPAELDLSKLTDEELEILIQIMQRAANCETNYETHMLPDNEIRKIQCLSEAESAPVRAAREAAPTRYRKAGVKN